MGKLIMSRLTSFVGVANYKHTGKT